MHKTALNGFVHENAENYLIKVICMIFQDNVIKAYLKNVYFITGTPCGGKTTISRELGRRHHVLVYDIDEQFPKHQEISNPDFQPAMNKAFENADAFFGRTVEEYKQWLLDNTREQLDFVLLDLIRLSQNRIVLCDCHLTVEEADRLTDPERIVFLIKEPSNLVEDYCNRPDHQGFRDFINSTSDTEKAKAVCNETLKSLNEQRYERIKNSDYFWIERNEHSTVDETVRSVERHFRFAGRL
ncbi:MAG: AAA family ATPase [Hominenteromicrobium sp.]